MFGLIAVLILVGIFHREVFLGVFLLIHRPSKLEHKAYDAELIASGFQAPILYAIPNLKLASSSFKSLFGTQVFVRPQLWESLDDQERKDFLFWNYASCERYNLIQKLTGFCDIFAIDRDALHLGAKSASLVSCFEKARATRTASQQELTAGLSMLGHSLVRPWPPLENRVKALAYESRKYQEESPAPNL